MGYGDVAVTAVMMCKEKKLNPCDAWVLAAREHFPASLSAQKKGCPKGAFLGLCSEGWIPHVPKKCYSRAVQNWGYAVKAVRILQVHPHAELPNPTQLWSAVMAKVGKEIVPNGQMDVVLGLWAAGLIVPRR